ncbi:hypothetical protein GS636_13630 [Ruegeria sp. HKCCD4884]|uniref:helix-turn-helix domain-containing protein n=1 Tax=Ruegeria sp. HKCCD4884 TaxID=2683022 RepID=UPI001491CBA4|nr:helix-turn-helix domain-containing protein [Ruegeria sp. HKCCD4884]NOD93827.1 hypothetical protein [Ruegeria sp. HKCCD4884]
MKSKKPLPLPEEEVDDLGPASIFDGDPSEEEDLWFLPPDEVEEKDYFLPGPRSDQRLLFDPRDWRAAQSELSSELADLALSFGALDERLRAGPKGWTHRLALMETSDLGWWTGDRVSVDRLALWTGLRIGATHDDVQSLFRAGWAVRRLSSGAAPAEGGWETGLTAFLDRLAQGSDAAPDAIVDLAEVMRGVEGLHPITQSAIAFHAWRAIAQGVGQDTEAAVIAARHAATMGRGGAVFMPLALSGPGALRGAGEPAEKLGAWIRGAGQAALAGLLHLDRVSAWEAKARDVTQDLSGRTPPRLIEALTSWPMVSAPLAEDLTEASRAAVQRNFDLFSRRGLVREVTGQGRYRVWTAAL